MRELAAISPEAMFSIASSAAMIGWVILIFLPRRYDLLFAVPQYLIPLGLGLLYAGLMFANIYTVDGGYGSLDQVRALFSKDEVLLAGWVHYLAFDLFIGAWIARQSDSIGIPRMIQAMLLLATFMFGPVGLAAFLIMRAGYRKTGTRP
ncbi:ABA4-like family protein [Hyphococcus sp.]|uniref:ABA4-like family protein n=1 Tax=Hyphococcus sp. TaxID=2038636 RepID=UPI00207F964D|nr:MAG: hypothetical protein DHS20C04_11990 [Marinicaulis sp.]